MKRALLVMALVVFASLLAPGPASSRGQPWQDSEPVAFADAQATGRHVVVVFGAEWCSPCRKIGQILNDDTVFGLLSESFVPLYFDITELSDHDEALQAKYHASVLPAVIFIDAAGRELGRWDKNLSATGFIGAMKSILASHPLLAR